MRKNRMLTYCLIALALAFWFLADGRYSYSSTCRHCGLVQQTKERQVRFAGWRITQSSSEQQTPLSQALEHAGLIQPHKHDWMFNHGGGNGVRCAIGPGTRIAQAVQSSQVEHLFSLLHQKGESQLIQRLHGLVLQPETSLLVCGIALSIPSNDFESAADFETWLGDEVRMLDEDLLLLAKDG